MAQAATDKKCPHSQVSCGDCRMNALCLPLALQSEEIDRLDNIVQRGRPFHREDHVYNAGTEFKSVYAVRSGCIKSYYINDDGQEQVTGFHLPGEIFGVDGIGHNRYVNSAIALETSAICEIPFSRLEELSMQIPSLQRHFFQLMSREITNDQQLITQLSKNSAEERIATLVLSLSSRNARRKLSSTQLRLPMSRADIGNYLGLTVETVSRVFSRFQKQGILAVDKKEIEILDVERLQEMANT
ncbi:fumarate/nitrate reduction transcriptional regulator Fnr [bacterium SCSIO 12696]|nr:fumarate/nitrate reduction transcriptional regulator Fnr [bacterium SCSIO 12696]